MKLPDTNVWLALSLSKHTHHLAAKEWLDEQNSTGSLFFCRATQQSFLRLLTTAGMMNPYGLAPLTNKESWSVYEAFLADDRIVFHPEVAGVEAVWKRVAGRRTASPKLWMDAYLAAFAMTSGSQLVTIDRAFSQFPGLDVMVLGLQ